jgi:hypothetical protein
MFLVVRTNFLNSLRFVGDRVLCIAMIVNNFIEISPDFGYGHYVTIITILEQIGNHGRRQATKRALVSEAPQRPSMMNLIRYKSYLRPNSLSNCWANSFIAVGFIGGGPPEIC